MEGKNEEEINSRDGRICNEHRAHRRSNQGRLNRSAPNEGNAGVRVRNVGTAEYFDAQPDGVPGTE